MPELPIIVDAKLVYVKNWVLSKGKLQIFTFFVNLAQLNVFYWWSFDQIRKYDRSYSALEKVSLAPKLGYERILFVVFEFVL